jgi:trk system potassium uptake protein
MEDYLEIGENFALVKTTPPKAILGIPMSRTGVRSNYGVTVTAFHRPGAGWTYTSLDTVLEEGDVVLIAGAPDRVEAFSQLR